MFKMGGSFWFMYFMEKSFYKHLYNHFWCFYQNYTVKNHLQLFAHQKKTQKNGASNNVTYADYVKRKSESDLHFLFWYCKEVVLFWIRAGLFISTSSSSVTRLGWDTGTRSSQIWLQNCWDESRWNERKRELFVSWWDGKILHTETQLMFNSRSPWVERGSGGLERVG